MVEMKKVHFRNPGYVQSQNTKPIKIAVLDTGVDVTHSFIKGAMKKPQRIKTTRSFVDGVKDTQDSHGHGTHVAALLLKVAPDAHLYIARVASGGKIPAHHNIADVSPACPYK
jgi:subtilisin family serine protease